MYNAQGRGSRGLFDPTGCPVTIVLVVVNIITFFVIASGGGSLMRLAFTTETVSRAPWTLLTWPLLGAGHPMNVLFACLWAFWVCGSLERSWGTRTFGIFFFGVAALTGLSVYLGGIALNLSGVLIGLWESTAAPTIAWCALNKREVINLYGVIPIPVPIIGALTLVVLWYDVGPPLLGLFALVGCAVAYLYAVHGRYAFHGYAANPWFSRRPKLRVDSYSREAASPGGASPLGRYRAWQERRNSSGFGNARWAKTATSPGAAAVSRMIGQLSGLLARAEGNTVIIDVGGVGYLVSVPVSLLASLPGIGGKVTLSTHLIVREDELTLYGFATPADLEVFRILLGVTGVGPRVALALLSTLDVSELSRALSTNDTRVITKVPGVGPKLAQRLCLELGDKMAALAFDKRAERSEAGKRTEQENVAYEETVEGLVGLGFGRSDARRATDRVVAASADRANTGELIAQALKLLTAAK